MGSIRIETPFPNIAGSEPNANEIRQLQQWTHELTAKGIPVDAHIRLFLHEFLVNIEPDFKRLVKRFANEKDIEFMLKVGEEAKLAALDNGKRENQAEFECDQAMKKCMFKIISQKGRERPDALPYLLAIIAKCKHTDTFAYEELHLNNLADLEYYARLYEPPDIYKVDRIRALLEPLHILKWFKSRNVLEYETLLQRIEQHFMENNPEKRNIEQAVCLLIRGLAHTTDSANSTRDCGDWYYDFLEACMQHGYTRWIPRKINPNFQEELTYYHAKKHAEINNVPILTLDLVREDAEGKIRKPRNQLKHIKDRKQTVSLEYEPSDYFLRPYQNELVVQANSGRNTIICAPTGCGKTLIAVDIIKNHLTNVHREGRVGRCVMLVPTIPLVDQQALQFVEYLGYYKDPARPEAPYWIDGFSGCENVSEGRAKRLLACDICVMTPQILINMMNSVLRTERVYFADFSLIIFDECHHCDRAHPYKVLMDMYEKEKPRLLNPIQIVGLTASMGVGDSGRYDMQSCHNHMLNLCANMNAESISTVRHQLDNLKSYVVPPVDEIRRVSRPKYNPFVDLIDTVMLQLEGQMHTLIKELIAEKKIRLEKFDFPPHHQQSTYQTSVGTLKGHLQRIQDPVKRFYLVRGIDHLSHYFHAILISDLLPSSYALDYLSGKMANYVDTGKGSSANEEIATINQQLMSDYKTLEKKLIKAEKSEKLENKEILCELHHILLEQFTKDPDSRCLIFVATRNCAQKLSDYLTKVPELPLFYNKKNVGYMVSSNQSGAAGGQSSQEQQQMRNDFDHGNIKVLVVTSVAEEGVNIAACNLIIKYNNVGSERSMIQRRGRARKKDSRSILLALDLSTESAEYANIRKEAMMMKCIENLQEMTDIAVKEQIQQKMEQHRKEREDEQMKIQYRREELKDRLYKLSCYSCNTTICRSVHIRSIANQLYIVCDPTVWERSKIDIRAQPSKDGQLTTTIASWRCNKCPGIEWGTIIKFSNSYLPQLANGKFTLERLDQRDVIEESHFGRKGTWNQVQAEFFNIDPINSRNIKEMYSSLLSALPDLIKQMEQQEYIANRKFIEKMKQKQQERKDKSKIQIFLEE